MKAGRRYTDEETGINFTAVLDVVFVIMVLFFVSTFFIVESAPPEGDSAAEAAVEPAVPPIEVSIDATSLISIEGRLHERAVIRASLEKMKADRPGAALNISVHPDADTGALAVVVEAARDVGIDSVSVSTGEES